MKALRRLAFLIIALAIASSFISCSEPLNLDVQTIEMEVGDYIDLQDHANAKVSSISVTNNNLVTIISGTVIRAERVGELRATVYHLTQTADAVIKISYKKPQLTLSCASQRFTTIRGSVMDFYADIGANADPTTQILWYVDDILCGTGTSYSLNANEYKSYVVTARAGDCEQSLTAVCYRPFEKSPEISCDVKGVISPNDTVNFTCDVDAYTEWFVNGQFAGLGRTFAFKRGSGEYAVSASVNGLPTNPIQVVVGGVVEPTDLTVDFDSDYPNIYLRWELAAKLDCEVKVSDKLYKVSGNVFDLSDLVSLDKSVCVEVRCLGGGSFLPSEFVRVDTPTVSDEGVQYLNKKYFDGNYYMTSDDEVYDLIEYIVIFRDGAESVDDAEQVTFSVYMGYDSEQSAATLLSKGWAYAEQTGRYGMAALGDTHRGGIATFRMTFFTPIEPQSDDRQKQPAEQLVTPNFGFGLSEFPIDDKKGAAVSTSEELFYVVQKGYRPIPKSGSAAERIYAEAREILGDIASDDMDDLEKARVIYEWIMWRTTYDVSVVNEPVSQAVLRPAYYLEGVFDYGFAVCDGISKSMSLLCNMVGIPCVRVVGTVESNGVAAHAWNYVRIDGKWYFVDATFGDSSFVLDNKQYERGTHYYFLKSAAQMPTHKPSYLGKYPQTVSVMSWYELERDYEDCYTDLYIEDIDDDLAAAVKCAAEQASFSVKIGDETINRDFYCFEIALAKKVKTYYLFHSEIIELALQPLGSAKWVINNDLLIVIVTR